MGQTDFGPGVEIRKVLEFDLRYMIQIKIGFKYLQTTFELDFQNRISLNHLFGNLQIWK
jgi:hypothetical protein